MTVIQGSHVDTFDKLTMIAIPQVRTQRNLAPSQLAALHTILSNIAHEANLISGVIRDLSDAHAEVERISVIAEHEQKEADSNPEKNAVLFVNTHDVLIDHINTVFAEFTNKLGSELASQYRSLSRAAQAINRKATEQDFEPCLKIIQRAKMQIEATEQAKVSHTALEERLDDNPNPQAAKILAQDAVALKIANAQSEHSRKDIHASEQAIRLLLQPIRFENSQLFEGLTKTRSGINLTGKVFRDVQMQTTLFTQNKPNRLEECLVTARACLGI